MAWIHPDAVEYWRKQFTRHDAHRYIRPDPERWLSPEELRLLRLEQEEDRNHQPPPFDRRAWLLRTRGAERNAAARQARAKFNSPLDDPEVRLLLTEIKLDLLRLQYWRKANFNPNQPRVPAGNPDGGQWTSDGGGGGGRNDPRVVSDAMPGNEWKPGAQYVQSRFAREIGPVRIGGRLVQPTPAQAVRLTVAQSRARSTIARVRELDPNWKPTPSTYESVEGLIVTYRAEAREAQARLDELARNGIGPGPFARESIPARGPERDFLRWEIEANNRNGKISGCHTCGTFNPETRLGNYVLDHQPPTAWNPHGRSQRLYPQCLSCSSRQGIWISRMGGRR